MLLLETKVSNHIPYLLVQYWANFLNRQSLWHVFWRWHGQVLSETFQPRCAMQFLIPSSQI